MKPSSQNATDQWHWQTVRTHRGHHCDLVREALAPAGIRPRDRVGDEPVLVRFHALEVAAAAGYQPLLDAALEREAIEAWQS